MMGRLNCTRRILLTFGAQHPWPCPKPTLNRHTKVRIRTEKRPGQTTFRRTEAPAWGSVWQATCRRLIVWYCRAYGRASSRDLPRAATSFATEIGQICLR